MAVINPIKILAFFLSLPFPFCYHLSQTSSAKMNSYSLPFPSFLKLYHLLTPPAVILIGQIHSGFPTF
jgi:hypothetical protein